MKLTEIQHESKPDTREAIEHHACTRCLPFARGRRGQEPSRDLREGLAPGQSFAKGCKKSTCLPRTFMKVLALPEGVSVYGGGDARGS